MFDVTPRNTIESPKTTERKNFFNDSFFDDQRLSSASTNSDQFFKPSVRKTPSPIIQKLPGSEIAATPLFNVITNNPKLFPITERAAPAGLSFALGGGGGPALEIDGQVFPAEDFLFSWEANVQAPVLDPALNDWSVGFLQTVRTWYANIVWGEKGANQVKCAGTFKNLHDGFDQSVTWFKNAPSGFNKDGMSDKIIIEDSPILQIPFTNPKTKSESFGYFDFTASFITYLSAFHKNEDPYNPEAYKHLKSVRWSVAVNGYFDGRDAINKIVRVKSGGTTKDDVIDAGSEVAPVLGGPLAIDEISKILQCWTL